MSPKRKALDTADANAAAVQQPTAKKGKSAAGDAAAPASSRPINLHEERWSKVSASKNLDLDYQRTMQDPHHAYEFMCICDPTQNDEDEWEDEEDEDEDEDDSAEANTSGDKQTCDGGKKCPCGKTAASLPDHPYTITRAGLLRLNNASTMTRFRDPDVFDMYTYNDHAAYGALEVVENMLLDFDEALKAKEWREMWAVVEAMVLFMEIGAGSSMCMADDGERIKDTAAHMARLILTALSTLESHDQLKKDSDIKNLGWIMALCHELTKSFSDMGVMDSPTASKTKTFKFNASNLDLYVRAYAHQHGIAIPGVSQDDIAEAAEVTMPKADAKDRWGWSKVKTTGIGGDKLDITTWSSAERKKAAFDKKDPLPRDVINKLKKGEPLMIG